MIPESGQGASGSATGVLLFGFLLGITVGSPLVGWSIDALDRYEPAWIAGGLACLLAVAVVARHPTSSPDR